MVVQLRARTEQRKDRDRARWAWRQSALRLLSCRDVVPSESMTDAHSSQVPIGTVLEGKFRVTQEIGRGGMATVYEAENIDIGKRVAVKILSAELITSRIVRERFIREARAAAAIHSPYICEVYDSGMYHDRPFLVMELLDGESLYDRMTRVRQLKVSTTLKVMRHVVRGLAKAHQAGVVHRDLKPENIFLTRDTDGRLLAKIVDFGLAKFYESRDGHDDKNIRLTREGALFGTPAYMSPEQARGQGEVDHRADLWALGCITYECLTGRTVWDVQQGVAMILAQIARGQLPDPREIRPDLSEAFVDWFKQALHPDLSQRFQTSREFLESMEAVLIDEADPVSSMNPLLISSRNADIPDPPLITTATPGAPSSGSATESSSGRAIAWLAVFAICALSGYAFWLYVLNPASGHSVFDHAAFSEPRSVAETQQTLQPIEQGPGAELINKAQQQFRSDQHEEALATLELARGENPNIALSLIRHANVALEETGSCRLAGIGRPRPFNVEVPASHARIALGSEGILAVWTDSHQDPKRRNVYAAVLDDSLRRLSPVRNVTPEASSAIHPALTPAALGFAALYWDSGSGTPGVYVRAISADGRIKTPARLLSAEKKEKYFPNLAVLPGGDLLSVWSEKQGNRAAIVVSRLNSELQPQGKPIALTSLSRGDATQPFATVWGNQLFVSYRYEQGTQTTEIRLLRIPLDSGIFSGESLATVVDEDSWAGESITLRSQPKQAEPSMVCDGEGCLVVWDDENGGAFAGYVPANQNATLWHREFSTKGKRPVVARNAKGDITVAYFAGDRLFLAPAGKDGMGEPSVISRVSGFQPSPTLIAGETEGDWLMSWRDYEAGHLEIFVARAHCSPPAEK